MVEEACQSIDRMTALLFEATPYTGHDDNSFREIVASYYYRFAEAVAAYPVVRSTDPFLVTPSALQVFPVGAVDALDDLQYTASCVRSMVERVCELSKATASPVTLADMIPSKPSDCERCASCLGKFMAFHVFETIKLFVSAPHVVSVRDKDPPQFNYVKEWSEERYLLDVVTLCLEQSWSKALGDMLQWYCFFCAELQRCTKEVRGRDAVKRVLHVLVSSFCGELAGLSGALAPQWPRVQVEKGFSWFEVEPTFVVVPNTAVFGAIAHSVLAGVIGYDGSPDRRTLQNLFGAMAPRSPGAVGSNVGFPYHGLAVDRCAAESCNVSMDYESPLFQVMVWWPEVDHGASDLTAEAVRRFVGGRTSAHELAFRTSGSSSSCLFCMS